LCYFSIKKTIFKINNAIAPVQNKDREIFMDVLRGFAILGILIGNLTHGGFGWGSNCAEAGGVA